MGLTGTFPRKKNQKITKTESKKRPKRDPKRDQQLAKNEPQKSIKTSQT